ncbi:MAG TPA: hypothetical protein VK438_10730 [Xanthobacteraceae bacterium]|nr:hypothetical protein [Xanthobacteraceae bacterium]
MTLSPQDATAALRDIDAAQARSATLRGYRRAAPQFLIWGVIWAAGYGLSDGFPHHANAIWAVLVPIGVAAGLFAGRGTEPSFAWRYGAITLAMLAFFAATFFVMAPVTGRQVSAFIPLFVALLYVLAGIFRGPRYVVAGLVVAAATLTGFVFIAGHFLLWMAVVGGGALILAGFWMRKV